MGVYRRTSLTRLENIGPPIERRMARRPRRSTYYARPRVRNSGVTVCPLRFRRAGELPANLGAGNGRCRGGDHDQQRRWASMPAMRQGTCAY